MPTETENPWETRESFEKPKTIKTVLTVLAVIVSSVAISLCDDDWISIAAILLLSAYAVWMIRMPRVLLPIFATAVLPVAFGLGFGAGSVLLSATIGTAAVAWLFTVKKEACFIPVFVAVACTLINILIKKFTPASLLILSCLPAGALLAYATRKGEKRTTAICFAEAGWAIVLLITAAALIGEVQGELSLASVTAFLDEKRDSLIATLIKARDTLLSMMEKNPLYAAQEGMAEALERTRSLYSDAVLTAYIEDLFNCIPGYALIVCGIVAFNAQHALCAMYRSIGWKQVLTRRACIFTMSLPASVLYFLSFTVVAFAPSSSPFVAVAENISLLLLPGFCYIGIRFLIANLFAQKGGFRIFLFLLLFLFCCCGGSMLFYLLAMYGAAGNIGFALRMRLAEKTNGNDRDPKE